MPLMALNETRDQLAMANNERRHGNVLRREVLRREGSKALRKALQFEVAERSGKGHERSR